MAPPQLPRSVMVVDDSGVFGFTLSLEFRRHGWDVFCCGSAEDALKKLKERTFDLVLSDIFMPGMRGDELAAVILRERPDARVILMSSMPRENTPPLPRGVAYIAKPVDVPMVLAAYERFSRGPSPPPAPPGR